MTHNDTEFGPPDGPRRDHAGIGTSAHAGHEPDHSPAHQGHSHEGHAGHTWTMMLRCGPMRVLAAALVAPGPASPGAPPRALARAALALLLGIQGHGFLPVGGVFLCCDRASASPIYSIPFLAAIRGRACEAPILMDNGIYYASGAPGYAVGSGHAAKSIRLYILIIPPSGGIIFVHMDKMISKLFVQMYRLT